MKITEFEKGDLIRASNHIGIVTKAEKGKYSIYWFRKKKTLDYVDADLGFYDFFEVVANKGKNRCIRVKNTKKVN